MDRLTKTDAELLQAYKDTGLEPEELTTMCKLCEDYVSAGLNAEFIQTCINAVQSGMSTERITEITNAESDGCLIVLPCKVGKLVYRLEWDMCRNEECTPFYCHLTVQHTCPYYDGKQLIEPHIFHLSDLPFFGKTIFPTHEAAETALRSDRDG